LESRVRGAGRNFPRHINKRVFQVLNGGDGSTYGAAYDGSDYFDNDHVDDGAHYQTNQDNEYALSLSIDNFETVYVAAQQFVDDQGQYTDYAYNLLTVHPTNERVAAQIVSNEWSYDTANRERNPYTGKFAYITSPELDTTAWHIIASDEDIKPIIVAMRKMPTLQDAWFDPLQPDGGRYYFKFFARYEMYYGDWRLAAQGNT
jgi:phage major head subunit gpT-like protein